MTSQIIAMGGGGFSMEPENLALDRYFIRQTGKPRPNICFVPTASGDSNDYITRFYRAFRELECDTSTLSLYSPPTRDLEDYVMSRDAIYVGGGNTRNLMVLWKEWALDAILIKALDAGILLGGVSAGANCWFEQNATDSIPGKITALNGMGILKGSYCPHFDGEPMRRPSYKFMVSKGELLPGYGVDDGAALHYIDGKLHKVVSSRPNATAYKIESDDGRCTETRLENEYLLKDSSG